MHVDMWNFEKLTDLFQQVSPVKVVVSSKNFFVGSKLSMQSSETIKMLCDFKAPQSFLFHLIPSHSFVLSSISNVCHTFCFGAQRSGDLSGEVLRTRSCCWRSLICCWAVCHDRWCR